MINSSTRPVIIIHSVFTHAHLKNHERKYITENLEKPLDISMIVYKENHSIQSVSIRFREMSSITLGADEIDGDIKIN